MAKDDILIIGGLAAVAAAYVTNFGGIRTAIESGGAFGHPGPGESQYQQRIKTPATTKTPSQLITPGKAEADILGVLGKSRYQTPLGRIYDAVSSTGTPTKCWRNYPCGSRTSVAVCKLTAQDAYNTWKKFYGCKTAKQAFAYEGFDNITMG